METLILFIGSAVANAVLGHYVTEGLKKNVDPKLGELFEEEADTEVIETYVRDNGLEEQVEEFAAQTVKSSVVIPDVSAEVATMSTRAALFGNVLRVGFDISNARRFDVLLPGSFLGPHAFTLFRNNQQGAPTITVNETVVHFDSSPTSTHKVLEIFPISETDGQALWETYRSKLLKFRSTTTSETYFRTSDWRPLRRLTEHCSVSRIMAGAIEFHAGLIMNPKKRESLGIPEGTNRAPLQQPYEGIHNMLDGMAKLLAIDLLDSSERTAMIRVYKQLRDLLTKEAD